VILEVLEKLKIGKDDLRFFFPLAAASGVLMEAFSWLPERVNRDYFSAIIYDHLPWTTIGTIFLLQAIIVLFYHAIKYPKVKAYAHDVVEHISIKIEHFCSPAFSVLLGLSLACTFWSISSLDYLAYSLAFGYFSLFFLIIPWMSGFLKEAINSQFKDSTVELFKVFGLALLGALLIVPFLNTQPIIVEFKLSLVEYDVVENVVSEEDSVAEFSRKATIDAALELNANKRVN
jgi:hypothetical protein